MRKIRTDTININAGMTNNGEPRPTSYPVDVWGDVNATDSIFKGTGVPTSQSNPGDPAPTNTWPDSSFTPHFDVQPKPPKGNAG